MAQKTTAATDNGHIESFDGRLRDEYRTVHQVTDLAHVREVVERWRTDHNEQRPHSALGHLTPREFTQQRQHTWTGEAA